MYPFLVSSCVLFVLDLLQVQHAKLISSKVCGRHRIEQDGLHAPPWMSFRGTNNPISQSVQAFLNKIWALPTRFWTFSFRASRIIQPDIVFLVRRKLDGNRNRTSSSSYCCKDAFVDARTCISASLSFVSPIKVFSSKIVEVDPLKRS